MFRRVQLASCIAGVILFCCIYVLSNPGMGVSYELRNFLKDSWWPEELLVLIIGGLIVGFAGSHIGSWVFSVANRRASSQSIRAVTRVTSAVISGVVGLVASIFSGFALALLWSYLIYSNHPERYPSDIPTLVVVCINAFLTSVFAATFGSGVIKPRSMSRRSAAS